jgi:hypothetical protein
MRPFVHNHIASQLSLRNMQKGQADVCACKTCKVADSEDGQVRCRECHAAFRHWLDGGEHYEPLWNGVVGAPSDADEPRTNLDRALALKKES